MKPTALEENSCSLQLGFLFRDSDPNSSFGAKHKMSTTPYPTLTRQEIKK